VLRFRLLHMTRRRLLILCTGNSARSQMAEGLVRHFHGDRFVVQSAGTRPGAVRPEAIAVMREIGIDISGHRSKHLDELKDQPFDWVLTVCDHARDHCPAFPGIAAQFHRSVPDPVAEDIPDTERLDRFRQVRDELARILNELAADSPSP
jgi:arsenate reductase (thioredoxin)